MRKVATFQFSAIKGIDLGDGGNMVKMASSGTFASSENAKKVIQAEVDKHPTALFFRAKAIEADVPNNNGDCFSAEELKKSCDTFIGVPFFTNHDNQDVEKAKGKVVWSEWNNDEKAIYVVAFVDREAYPNLCRGIEEEYMSGVSMGCSVEYSNCSICGNKASTMDEYCSHIRNFKGRKFTGTAKNVVTGQTKEFKEAPVFEDNFGIRFIELSGVADPACPSCHIDTIYDGNNFCGEKAASSESESLLKAASVCYNDLSSIKYAAMNKEASQSQIDSLNGALQTLEQVSVSLIQNRANVEMEFASDIVEILASLQDFVDQLVQAGYGQLPEATGQPVPGTLPEGGPAPGVQPVSAEEGLEPGSSNVDEPLLEEPELPDMEAFNEATRPSPSRNTGRLTRPARPVGAKKAKEDNEEMKRRLPNKSAKDRKRAKRVLSEDWQGQLDEQVSSLSETLKNDPFVTGSANGGQKMAKDKNVEAKSSHSDLHVITEKQLEQANVGANPREGQDRDEVTQGQLNDLRKGEQDVVTEKQLDTTEGANPREGEEREIITEKQLDQSKGANPREGKDRDEVTQGQLEPQRVGERDVITEKQLSNPPTDTPWERSCSTSMSKHIEASAAVLAKASIVSGETPKQILRAACSMAGGTASERLSFAKEVWNSKPNSENVKMLMSRASFWDSKKIKVASAGMTAKEAILAFASEAVHGEGLNPELLVESFAGIRDNDAIYVIDEEIDRIVSASSSEDEDEQPDIRAEINEYFSKKKVASNAVSESEAIIEAVSDKGTGIADHVIEASVDEVDCRGLEGEELRLVASSFAKGALAASKLKMASLINVTVENDVVTIAVETENESVEIPIGGSGSDIEEEPLEDIGTEEDTDILDEGLGEEPMMPEEPVAGAPAAGAPAPAASPAAPEAGTDILGLSSSRKSMTKAAQFGGAGGELPGGQGAGAGAPEDMATAPDMMPEGGGIQSFTDEPAEEEELEGGEQQEAGTICPICKSDDTETGRKDQQSGQFDCNGCGAKYMMHFNIDILNPEELFTGKTQDDALEMPEVPEMPVAAFVDLDKKGFAKYASDVNSGLAYCPGCGSDCKIDGTMNSHSIKCASCGTEARRDVLVDLDNPKNATLKVEWNLRPRSRKCAGCNKARKAFASDMVFKKMVKSASASKFPVANATAWIEKNYGKDRVVTYGPEKGRKLAQTVVGQLQSFGLDKVKYMKRLCEVQVQSDPMEDCLSMHKKQGFARAEAQRLCNCIKNKYATEADDNIFMAAFAGMIDDTILRKMAEHVSPRTKKMSSKVVSEDEMSISDIKIETKKKSEEKVSNTKQAGDKKLQQTVVEKEDNVPKGDGHIGKEKQTIPAAKAPQVPRGDAKMGKEEPPADKEVSIPVDMQYLGEEEPVGQKEISTKTLGIVAASEKVKGKKHMSDGEGGEEGKGIDIVESIEASDNVPRSDAKMGKEEPPADKSPSVPRGNATMGDEDPCNCEGPKVPQGPDAEKMEMRGRVAETQHETVVAKRREKAIKLTAGLVGRNVIAESEFEEVVSDLVQLPLDRMEVYAKRLIDNSQRSVKTASALTSPVVYEDRGLQVDEPKSLQDELAGIFTVGNQQSDRYFKDGSVDEE